MLAGVLVLLASACTNDEADAPASRAAPDAPNIVLITSDDQAAMELRWMPQTRRLLGRAGVTFDNMIAPHPNCCPARAQIVSGQYAHNNGVRTNSPPWGGHEGFDPATALPVWLQRAGYVTGLVGKYMHGYGEEDGIEPGWDRWGPVIGNISDYRSFVQYRDGEVVKFRQKDYHTDVMAQQSQELITDFAAGDKPFFLWASFLAPHGTCRGSLASDCSGPPPAAKRHAGTLGDVRLPTLDSPSFNEPDISDKPPLPRYRTHLLPNVNNSEVNPLRAQRLFTQRIKALAALDEAVAGIVAALEEAGELDNTVLMFTSDNGYMFGEHQQVGKNVPYEEAIRVPLVMRGPGIPAGERRSQTVAMIDFAPTITELAGATAMRDMDGESLLPYAVSDKRQPDRALLLQAGSKDKVKERAWKFRAVRTGRYTLVRWTEPNFRELYDRRRDPWQLTNVYDDPKYANVRNRLEEFLVDSLEDCVADDCRRPAPKLPRPGDS